MKRIKSIYAKRHISKKGDKYTVLKFNYPDGSHNDLIFIKNNEFSNSCFKLNFDFPSQAYSEPFWLRLMLMDEWEDFNVHF